MGASPILGPNRTVRCPSCGSDRLTIRSERDPIDRVYQTPSDMVRRLFVADMKLYHCYVCRLQFYDIGKAAEPAAQKTVEPAVEKGASAAPSAAERSGEQPSGAQSPATRPSAFQASLIGHTMTIRGCVSSQENILVNGEIQGNIDIPAHRLTIGTGGRVYGDVRAAEVVTQGTLEGGAKASQAVILSASATMTGDIRTPIVRIEEGAFFRGKIETA